MKQLENLIAELEAIAEKNIDEFRYSIQIKRHPRTGRIHFWFEAVETADGHCFVSGNGDTIESCIEEAHKSVPDAAEQWGYEV